MNQLRRLAFPLKQHTERRLLRLGLSPRNVSDHLIWLMPRHKLFRSQVDLASEPLPRQWRATPLGHKDPIAVLRHARPMAKVTQNPVGREPAGRLTLPRRRAITAPLVPLRVQAIELAHSQREVKLLRCGNIKATLLGNTSEKGPFFATTFSRPFKDQSGAWRNGTSFGLNDLEALRNVAFEAEEWITAHVLKR